MHLLAGNIIMGRLARAGTGVFDLLLNDDHDVLTFDGIARSLLRASIVTAQIDNPLGLSPAGSTGSQTVMPFCGRIIWKSSHHDKVKDYKPAGVCIHAESHKQTTLCHSLVCIGYVQEVSSALQQLLSCVGRSSQSSQAVAQQAIAGLTRMAGQHTLVPHDTGFKPILHLVLQHTGSITCVWLLFCPGSMKESPLAIASHLCHNLHELNMGSGWYAPLS